ncbi:hypothetical protein GCM10009613_61280 [Pseudonocardia kongjuensis]|uniref:Minor tail protein n=1 Tax=Pseudonocardia kongjuensis TaxID=102227 RepID=A0ABP4J220_9PSEU
MPNYDQRLNLDNRFGQLSGAVVAAATVLSSADFTTLPSDLSLERYLPLVLADDSAKVYEIAWATAHVEGSQNLTVIRGREGSAARQWGAGTAWRVAATARDGLLSVANRAGLPGDAHLGMKVMIRAENRVVEKTSAGWRATETIFGHAGRTAGIQSATGVVVMTAAQRLLGGMTFAGGGLVAPIAGAYLVSLRVACTGPNPGRFTGAVQVSGTIPAESPVVSSWKGDNADTSGFGATTMTLAAGDVLIPTASFPSGDSTYGTTGYNGSYVEALYQGPA